MTIRPYRDPIDEAPRVAIPVVVVRYAQGPRWASITGDMLWLSGWLLMACIVYVGPEASVRYMCFVMIVLILPPMRYWCILPPTTITVDHSAGHLKIRRRARWPGRPLVRTVRLSDVLAVDVVRDPADPHALYSEDGEVVALRLVNGDLLHLLPNGSGHTKHHEAVAAQLRSAIMPARASVGEE